MTQLIAKPKVLVTGGHGFIGHHLVIELLKQGFEVIVIDNHFIYPTIWRTGGRLEHLELIHNRIENIKQAGEYTFINGDVRDSWARMFERMGVDATKITHVVHLANIPRQAEAQYLPKETAETITHGILQINSLPNLERAVFVSSSMVYGDFNEPACEEYPVSPKGMYGTSRLIGEHLFRAVMSDHPNKEKLSSFIVRPTAVYGPMDSTVRVVGKFMKSAIMGEELHVRGRTEVMDFTHVDDVVQGLTLTLNAKARTGVTTTYNVSRGKEVNTILDLAQLTLDTVDMGATIVVRDKDESMPSRHLLDTSLISKQLGYESKWSLKEGLETVYKDLKGRIKDQLLID